MYVDRMVPRVALWVVGLLLCLPRLEAGVRRADVPDTSFLALAASSLHSSVGKLTYSVGSNSYLASGVLISPDWVLTAGHVVGGNNYQGGGINDLTFSLNSGSGILSFAASEWHTHPGWSYTQGDFFSGYDLRLIS